MANSLTSGTVVLTEACNLNCKYCYEGAGRQCGKKMSKELSEKIVEFFIKNAKDSNTNKVDITFFGGEPSLNVDVMLHMFDYAVVRCQKEHVDFDCMIVTNTTVFTDEYRKFLKHWYSILGKVNIQLSIDGIPDVQNENRITSTGSGSSELVEQTVKKYHQLFDECGIPKSELHIHGCITKSSLPHLKESYDYFRDVLGVEAIWFMPIHEEDWNEADVTLFGEQLRSIGDRIVADCCSEKTSKYFDWYSSFKCSTQKKDAPCSAGKNFCTIDTEGNIYACHRFMFADRENTIGHIDTGVDENKTEFFREYDMTSMFGEGACSDCTNDNCYICIAANYESNKNMVIGFPKYCKMSKMEDTVRWEIRARLEKEKILDPVKKSCSCGGSCSKDFDEAALIDKVRDTYRPVFEALDEKFKKLGELNESYASAFTSIDEKADKALQAAKDAIDLATNMFGIVEKIYAELEDVKKISNK